jgi:hypothetical protein
MSAVTGAGALRVRELHAEAIADVGLGDPVGNDPRVRRAPPEYNLPVISRLPGIWYDERLGASSQVVLPDEHEIFTQGGDLEHRLVRSNEQSIGWAAGPSDPAAAGGSRAGRWPRLVDQKPDRSPQALCTGN